MDGIDSLLTVAEVAVAFAGFATLAGLIGHDPSPGCRSGSGPFRACRLDRLVGYRHDLDRGYMGPGAFDICLDTVFTSTAS